MSAAVAIGVLDSGMGAGQARAARRFVAGDEGAVLARPAGLDRLGHGTAIAGLILREAPAAVLLSAQVFERGLATPAAVAAGLRWLVRRGARLVNMSFGLREDRAVLRQACREAVEAGVLVVASVPAIGPQVFPAAYPGIVRVTGDARCAGWEIAAVGSPRVDFGANPWADPCDARASRPRVAGASIAAARVTAALAVALAADPAADPRRALERLAAGAVHHGQQRVGAHA